ncbi:dUTP diphosphatase [Sharpea porci]|uniref:dUTP diphosphatase n=1 Tax=Sharpea porci TaxID=2652286 RepID=UPI0024097289|nr:dUTP diphosphatase [Sharpea porci]MDD6712167.1 dUTP diphosphatase [Sharpea porci]MDY5278041.1 dUTP diphosphatase [Sharpea porci]
MNEVAKLYQLVVNRELAKSKNEVLDVVRIKKKLLAFLQSVSELGEIAHIYTFWDENTTIHRNELLDAYTSGMTMLMSVAYDMRIDEIKKYEEIPDRDDLVDLLLKIDEDIVVLKNSFKPIDLENALNDYFHLGFLFGFSLDEIIEQLS